MNKINTSIKTNRVTTGVSQLEKQRSHSIRQNLEKSVMRWTCFKLNICQGASSWWNAQPCFNCGYLQLDFVKLKTWLLQGKNKACRPLFTLWISPSCCKRCRNTKKQSGNKALNATQHQTACDRQAFLKYSCSLCRREGHKQALIVEVWLTPKSQMCRVRSPSAWGACPGLTSCLFLSHTSEKQQAVQLSFCKSQHRIWVSQDKGWMSWHIRQWGKQNAVMSSQKWLHGQTNRCRWHSLRKK